MMQRVWVGLRLLKIFLSLKLENFFVLFLILLVDSLLFEDPSFSVESSNGIIFFKFIFLFKQTWEFKSKNLSGELK